MKPHSKLLLVAAIFTVSTACGRIGVLEQKAGHAGPPPAYGQTEPQTAERLTIADAQARPGRSSDDLLRRSTRRVEDPFDLPPGRVTDNDNIQPAQTESAPPENDGHETP